MSAHNRLADFVFERFPLFVFDLGLRQIRRGHGNLDLLKKVAERNIGKPINPEKKFDIIKDTSMMLQPKIARAGKDRYVDLYITS